MIRGKIKVILERLTEPSTWAGIATLLVLFNVVDVDSASQFSESAAQVVGGLAAIAAIFLKENKK
ncbi:hypothetical protein DMW20_11855 [Vibrio parahaemolyticus]|nr:hypothetical protein [Vibrio parahaemolyticus]